MYFSMPTAYTYAQPVMVPQQYVVAPAAATVSYAPSLQQTFMVQDPTTGLMQQVFAQPAPQQFSVSSDGTLVAAPQQYLYSQQPSLASYPQMVLMPTPSVATPPQQQQLGATQQSPPSYEQSVGPSHQSSVSSQSFLGLTSGNSLSGGGAILPAPTLSKTASSSSLLVSPTSSLAGVDPLTLGTEEKWKRYWLSQHQIAFSAGATIPHRVIVISSIEECCRVCSAILEQIYVHRCKKKSSFSSSGSNAANAASCGIQSLGAVGPAGSGSITSPNQFLFGSDVADLTSPPEENLELTPPNNTTGAERGVNTFVATLTDDDLDDLILRISDPLQPQHHDHPTAGHQKPPRNFIAVDVEGEDLGKNGAITVLSIATKHVVFIFDVAGRGIENAHAMFKEGKLAEVLEEPHLFKLMFDCRADSDALRVHHHITIRSVCDLQVMATLATSPKGAFLAGMQKVFMKLNIFNDETEKIREQAQLLFDPASGGTYDAWKKRPFPEAIQAYCALDVQHFFLALLMLHKYVRVGCRIGHQRLESVYSGNYSKSKTNNQRDWTDIDQLEQQQQQQLHRGQYHS